jgi:uncharacterized membrane protein YbhN (UPF0104 family)
MTYKIYASLYVFLPCVLALLFVPLFFLSLSPFSVSQLEYLSFSVALLQVVRFNILIDNVIWSWLISSLRRMKEDTVDYLELPTLSQLKTQEVWVLTNARQWICYGFQTITVFWMLYAFFWVIQTPRNCPEESIQRIYFSSSNLNFTIKRYEFRKPP